LIRAKITYSISLLTLAKTLGLQYSEAHPSQPLEALGDLEVHPQKIDLNDAIATAKADRPFLKVQRQNMLIQAENVKVQRAGYQPTIQANGGYEGRNLSSNDLSNVVRGWFLGVTGTWNIFDGGATYGNVKQARAQLEEAKVTYDDSVHQVELEVQQAVDNLQQAKETLESQLKTVEQALEAVRLAQERLNAGAGVQLDVLNAQVALTQARSTVLQAQHDYLSAQADFEKATATATKYDELFDDPLVKKARSKKNQ
jgi:outer membrane protein TolC